MRAAPILLLALAFALFSNTLRAQEPGPRDWDPLFAGYGTEPEMDFGGRTVMSLQSLVSRSVGSIGGIGERHPGLAPAWEFPAAAAVLLVQHEVDGHGGRAREFGLSPSYAFHWDFSAATGTRRPPATQEEGALLAAGGVEADGVMAHRAILESLSPEGLDGAKVPLLLMSKLDLSVYVSTVERPRRGNDFVEQYRDGNDMAYWLVSRQGARRGVDARAVWNGVYEPATDDPLLDRNWREARTAALWNALDPSLAAAVVGYFRQHVLGGDVRVHAPVLRVGERLGLSLGTRAALGPREVSRYLDLYAAAPFGVLDVYVRDLDSSLDRAYGYGAALHGLRLGPTVTLGLAADTWEQPDARENIRSGSGWNATGEVDARLGARWGLAAKVGSKSEGFAPGLPLADGVYVGLGLTASY